GDAVGAARITAVGPPIRRPGIGALQRRKTGGGDLGVRTAHQAAAAGIAARLAERPHRIAGGALTRQAGPIRIRQAGASTAALILEVALGPFRSTARLLAGVAGGAHGVVGTGTAGIQLVAATEAARDARAVDLADVFLAVA